MTWFRVEDTAEKIVVLIEADSAEQACRNYIKEYPPNLYAKAATAEEIEEWRRNPYPWRIL